MIVALFALVIASTGTAFAAQSALIPGSHIVAHSITAKQLAPGAVNHNALGNKAVRRNNFGGTPPKQYSDTVCANGQIVVAAPCPVGAIEGAQVTIPAGGAVLNYFSGLNDTGIPATLNPSPGHGIGFAPNAETALTGLNVQMSSEPAAKWPSSISVSLIINGFPSSAFCIIENPTPGGSNHCQSSTKVTIPANSSVAFYYNVINTNLGDPSWDSFELTLSYLSLAS